MGCIARLNTTGVIDGTFNAPSGVGASNPGLGTTTTVYSIALQSDGKILIAGNFTKYNGASVCYGVARLNADGSLDTITGFNSAGAGASGGMGTTAAYSIAVQSDGKILIGGNFTAYNGASVGCIARLNADGTIDSTFNPPSSSTNSVVYSIAVQGDGKILIGGGFTFSTGGTTPVFDMARLNSAAR